MRAAFISFTEKGRLLSARIAESSVFPEMTRYCFHTHSDEDSFTFDDTAALAAEIFYRYDALIFVCACGIAVRSIAGLIRSKTTDPAVIVIDDSGRTVIPLLSGHIGGANAAAVKIADLIGAYAAVTTATDTGGKFSPDSFAAANDLIITDMDTAKAAASAVLDGEKLGLVSEYPYISLPDDLTEDASCRIGLYIGTEDKEPFPVTLKLIPRNIVIGIGCKKGTPAEIIEKTVLSALESAGISPERVKTAASIDLKANEAGIISFCEKYGAGFETFSAAELMEVSGDFASSEFVKKTTGADNVCERSAVRCSGGRLILRKTAAGGVTVAAAEKNIVLDFERKMF